MQLVAIEIADEMRRIEQRPRPARRGVIDLAQRVAAILGVGCDHDGDVMIGQRRRQFDFRDDIERHQFDAGLLQQKFDRRVAAHVGRRRQRQHAQPRILDRAGRTEQLMRREDLVAGSQDPPACRRAIARSATDRAPRPPRRCRRSAWRSACRHSGRRSSPLDRHFVSLARPMRSAQGGRAQSTGSVRRGFHLTPHRSASAGAANCEEISPWNTDGPT